MKAKIGSMDKQEVNVGSVEGNTSVTASRREGLPFFRRIRARFSRNKGVGMEAQSTEKVIPREISGLNLYIQNESWGGNAGVNRVAANAYFDDGNDSLF